MWGGRCVWHALQDRMAEERVPEVFDHQSGGMYKSMSGQYASSYYVEGMKTWHPQSGRKIVIVSTNASNVRSRRRWGSGLWECLPRAGVGSGCGSGGGVSWVCA